ncbi:MAG TPA: FliG C-terminal domain-containing protein [Spirochaetota bacterium]|nr:FliG C-terminal domain-containing protein [Spirochaetota bacterium]HPF06244.1 FliG C-terminal domain-containing protein [Spirochaetota bacterium]HPJ41427.1 FliG C-terminal domain-containing protein [Spirochaetota bacterium]HPR36472.1 FliG C-terminal domain-containing protein [Spirochaetota bacterium]HRX47853.1 FliG C-terminal domain-containing protein [Spirochaetota bacterium]
MKSIFDMSGTEKAAALLMILGPEIASDIMKHLDETSIEKLSSEMIRIKSLPAGEKEDLFGEFLIELKRSSKQTYGGKNRAKKLISDTFGEEKAEELIKKIENRDAEAAFKFLDEADDRDFISLLKNEQPQVIALVMKYVNPKKAGLLMKSIDPGSAKTVALRIAKMTSHSPEAAVAVARAMKKRYNEMKKHGPGDEHANGIESLISIISHMSSDQEKKILQSMDISIPHISREISERIFSFENILNLTNVEIRILIDEINDDHLIAKALKGAGDEIKFKFMRNMSQNRATEIISEMDLLGPVKLSEIDECRNRIVDIMRVLNENGVISLRRSGEIYVE